MVPPRRQPCRRAPHSCEGRPQLLAGEPDDEILADLPYLESDDITAVLAFAARWNEPVPEKPKHLGPVADLGISIAEAGVFARLGQRHRSPSARKIELPWNSARSIAAIVVVIYNLKVALPSSAHIGHEGHSSETSTRSRRRCGWNSWW